MKKEEVEKLPNLFEVVEQVLQEEYQILSQERPPQIVIESSLSAIHKPSVEYFNDYDENKFIAVRLSSRDLNRPEKFAFKPNLKNRAFLFRGQSGFYNPSTPSLLRKRKEDLW